MTKVHYSPETVKIILAELSELCKKTQQQIAALEKAAPKSDERSNISGDLAASIDHLKIKTTLIEEAMEDSDWEF
jgi:hypothetical protein